MKVDITLLETSCNLLGKCPLRKGESEKSFHHSMCKGWCDHYSWDEKSYPNKPEYFSKSQLRKVVEKLGDGDSAAMKAECWEFATGITEMMTEDPTILLTSDLTAALTRLQKLTEDSSFLDLLVLYSELRMAIRAFMRIQGKIQEGRELAEKNNK